MKLPSLFARETGTDRLARLHALFIIYNGAVVLLLAGFLSITQTKIIETRNARAFLSHLPSPPLPPLEGFCLAALSFTALALLSRLYRSELPAPLLRYACLALEIAACVLTMRSLSLAYDGIVLLVVVDLMHRYSGRHQVILLAAAMLGLYAIFGYNLALSSRSIVPFDAYVAYYAPWARSLFSSLHHGFTSLNLVFFVLYLVLFVRQKHQEKERIASLNRQLAEANERLRAYAVEAEHLAETRERNRLAREIHDTLGHALTGIAAGIDAVSILIDIAPAKAKSQLAVIKDTAMRGLKDVRRSVKKLRPDDLEHLSLRQAIEQMVASFSSSTGMTVDFSVLTYPPHLRQDQEEVLYRVVQEGLTNAQRHGRATHVSIALGMELGTIFLCISDNGRGADTEKLTPGFGLRHMEERLALLKGRVRYWSDQGFTLEVLLPANEEASKFL